MKFLKLIFQFNDIHTNLKNIVMSITLISTKIFTTRILWYSVAKSLPKISKTNANYLIWV